MSRITTAPKKNPNSNPTSLRFATISPRTERMHTRIAELDLAYGIEVKRLRILLAKTKSKYFSLKISRS